MHFCHVATGLLGGPEVIVRQLLEMQMAGGHHVSLVFSTVHGGDERVVRGLPSGPELIRWDAGRAIEPVEDYKALRKLVCILRNLKPDVVHLHNSKAGALGRIACRSLGLRNIYSPHGPAYLRTDISAFERWTYYSLESVLCLLGDQLIASSQSELRAIRFLPGAKRLINNGVDCALIEWAASGSPVVPPSGRFRIVLCGRIWPQKNPEFVGRLAMASPADWEWIWIGDGHQRAMLDANPRLTVIGWQSPSDTLSTVRTADVYLQPSLWEGMSFALLEAMALGRPCVVSNVIGNRDLVRSGISGFVCDSEDKYMAALRSLATDVNLRLRLGRGAAREIKTSFNLDSVIKKWSTMYRSLLPPHSIFAEFRSSREPTLRT